MLIFFFFFCNTHSLYSYVATITLRLWRFHKKYSKKSYETLAMVFQRPREPRDELFGIAALVMAKGGDGDEVAMG